MDSLQQAMLYQAMMQGGANMLQAGAPSTDPRSGSLAYALGQGLQGGMQGAQVGLQQQAAIQKMKAEEAERKRQEMIRQKISEAMNPPTQPMSLSSAVQGGLGTYQRQAMPENAGLPGTQRDRITDAMYQAVAAGGGDEVRGLAALLEATAPEKKQFIQGAGGGIYAGDTTTGKVTTEVFPPDKEDKNERLVFEKFNIGPDNKFTKGEMHTWAIDPINGERLKYVGPATPAGVGAGGYGKVLLQTDQGIKVFDKTKDTVKNVKTPEGEQIYKVTPSDVKNMNIAFNDNINSIAKIREVFDKGGVGPIVGRTLQYGTKFFDDKETMQLKNRTAQLRTIIYGLSGKQINESEQEWLKNDILPNLTQPGGNFETALNEFEAWVKYRQGALQNEYPSLKQGATQAKPKVSDFWK